MDIKSAVFWGIVSFSVGGGFYGMYLRITGPALFDQIAGLDLFGKCMEYNSNPQLIPVHIKEINAFLEIVRNKLPEIAKSDAVVTLAIATTGESPRIPAGAGTPLQMCVKELTENIEKYNKATP